MKISGYSKAKILTLISIFLLAVTAICKVLATMLEGSTNRDRIKDSEDRDGTDYMAAL